MPYSLSSVCQFYSLLLFFTDVRIGFAQDSYSVGEAAGTVSVSVRVLEGELGINATVRLTTADGTAIGMLFVTQHIILEVLPST